MSGEGIAIAVALFQARQNTAADQSAFVDFAVRAAQGDRSAVTQLQLAVAQASPNWKPEKLQAALWQTLGAAIETVGDDGTISVNEEKRLEAIANAIGLSWAQLRGANYPAFETLIVCRINAGRPPQLFHPGIILKAGESAHGDFAASLLKEVAVREWRGRSSGVSIPIGFGMRYRTGGTRGRSVVIGTELVAADAGAITVTSNRAVFAGTQKTLEFRYDKLVAMEQYTDGLSLGVSNRQATSVFRFDPGNSPSIAAALISYAAST